MGLTIGIGLATMGFDLFKQRGLLRFELRLSALELIALQQLKGEKTDDTDALANMCSEFLYLRCKGRRSCRLPGRD